MRKLKIRHLSWALLVLAFVAFGCPNAGLICTDVPDMQCSDGSIPQMCVSLVDQTCGVKIMGEYYECDCDTVETCVENTIDICL